MIRIYYDGRLMKHPKIFQSLDGKIEIRDYEGWKTSWYKNGVFHRGDGPAVEFRDGDKEYWVDGKLHREDGPALDYAHKKAYYKHGKLHREDGPAEIYPDGVRFFLDGKEYAEVLFEIEMKKRKNSCNGKIVEIEGKKYKLMEVK